MIYLFVGLVLWCVISFWFFFSILGQKFRKGKWYDWPLLGPAYVIIVSVFWISTKVGWEK